MNCVYRDTKKQQKQLGGHFETDKEIFQIYNSLSRAYGCLPSDLLGLSWEELLFNLQCLQVRSDHLQNMLKQQNRKKAMLFPIVNMTDLVDLL